MRSKRTRRQFSKEFRLEAVRLVREEGKSLASVAADLGIYVSTLGKWVKKHDTEQARASETALSEDEREELIRLRREVRDLREDREILEKAAAFFARKKK